MNIKIVPIGWDTGHFYLVRPAKDKRELTDRTATAQVWDAHAKVLYKPERIEILAKWNDWEPFKGKIPGMNDLEEQFKRQE
jgi:hypothetical protein